ncbi:MAG: S8 family peptidase [Saccharothrix sp.]|nr:S8 family peptidase [Saccharothrix sp.]
MRPAFRTLAVLASAATAATVATGVAGAEPHQARIVTAEASASAQPIKDSYIVTLDRSARGLGAATAAGVTPTHVYDSAFTGFAAKLTPAQLRKLSRDPSVQLIEQDMLVTDVLDTTQTNPPSWGIDRIDQRNLPLSNSYTYTATGAGVHAYIIDTGITPSHPDFGGRASFDYNAIDSNNTDCNGHGTHVAGTVGSNTYGVAKGVRLHGVKMMNCSGSTTTSAAIAAVNWVTANAQKPAVANTSWNYPANSSLETAIRNMISSGVFLATSAGNTGGNSCDRLPRKVETASVVASSERTDARSSFSSTGACVDLYAPGGSIISTLNSGGSGAKSGTSMATPHVTGVAALYKSRYGDVSSATVHNWLNANATPNVISGGTTGGTVNRLLYTTGL